MILPEPVGVDHPLMTLRHAAARTGLSATTLRRYIKAGRLRARLIPGRYGPEYVVDDDDLRIADLLGDPRDVLPVPAPRDLRGPAPFPPAGSASAPPVQAAAALPVHGPEPGVTFAAHDAVPGLFYRELLMKHEQLLVQHGMMRVSGQQLLELREEARRREEEARESATELALIRDRHAREIGVLKARLRQAELEIAAREDEINRLKLEQRRAEIASRNAATVSAIDEEYAKLQRAMAAEAASRGVGGEHARDH